MPVNTAWCRCQIGFEYRNPHGIPYQAKSWRYRPRVQRHLTLSTPIIERNPGIHFESHSEDLCSFGDMDHVIATDRLPRIIVPLTKGPISGVAAASCRMFRLKPQQLSTSLFESVR